MRRLSLNRYIGKHPTLRQNPETVMLLALGGNQPSEAGGPAETLRAALREIAATDIRIASVSRFYVTPCMPVGAGPDYVNAAARVVTDRAPEDMLARLHEVEARFGRARNARWAARPIDLDLLAAGSAVRPDSGTQDAWRGLSPDRQGVEAPDQLILPHPRLQDRGFVLVPLADIAPDWRHPRTGQSVTEMLTARPRAELRAIRPL